MNTSVSVNSEKGHVNADSVSAAEKISRVLKNADHAAISRDAITNLVRNVNENEEVLKKECAEMVRQIVKIAAQNAAFEISEENPNDLSSNIPTDEEFDAIISTLTPVFDRFVIDNVYDSELKTLIYRVHELLRRELPPILLYYELEHLAEVFVLNHAA